MVSFTKFLKIVLPIASATTATIASAYLISFKKLDQVVEDDLNNQKFDNFDSVNEDFDEKVSFIFEDGKKEEISTKDLNKAKEVIQELKKEPNKQDLPFESKEKAIGFLNKFSEKALSELLQESNLSNDELANLNNNQIVQNSKLDIVIQKQYSELRKPQINIPKDSNIQIPNLNNLQNIDDLISQIPKNLKDSYQSLFDSKSKQEAFKLAQSLMDSVPSMKGKINLPQFEPSTPFIQGKSFDIKLPEFKDLSSKKENSLVETNKQIEDSQQARNTDLNEVRNQIDNNYDSGDQLKEIKREFEQGEHTGNSLNWDPSSQKNEFKSEPQRTNRVNDSLREAAEISDLIREEAENSEISFRKEESIKLKEIPLNPDGLLNPKERNLESNPTTYQEKTREDFKESSRAKAMTSNNI